MKGHATLLTRTEYNQMIWYDKLDLFGDDFALFKSGRIPTYDDYLKQNGVKTMTKSDELLSLMLQHAGNPPTHLLVEVANHIASLPVEAPEFGPVDEQRDIVHLELVK